MTGVNDIAVTESGFTEGFSPPDALWTTATLRLISHDTTVRHFPRDAQVLTKADHRRLAVLGEWQGEVQTRGTQGGSQCRQEGTVGIAIRPSVVGGGTKDDGIAPEALGNVGRRRHRQ